jgi:hypothetical protein
MIPIQDLITRMNNINAEQLTRIAEKEVEKQQLDIAITGQEQNIATYNAQKEACNLAIAELNANIVLDNGILVILKDQI